MFKLKGNFALCISGPSNCGKTFLCCQILNNGDRLFENKFDKIFWILGDPNAKPTNLNVKVEYMVGLPEDFQNTSGKPQLYVLDDSMFESQNKNIALLLSRGCHHNKLSVMLITQNLFHQSKYARDISLNFSYLCIMNNIRDRQQFHYLARQLYPENPSELVKVYKGVTQDPYSYLFIDLNQNTHNLFRFRTDILNPNYSTVFCPSIPLEINGESVQNEVCDEGTSHSACFTTCQV